MFSATLTAVVCVILQNGRAIMPSVSGCRSSPLTFSMRWNFGGRPDALDHGGLARGDTVSGPDPDRGGRQVTTRHWEPVGSRRASVERSRSTAPNGIHQRAVPGDTNEHRVALEGLKDLVLTGRVVTADAAFCHQDVAKSSSGAEAMTCSPRTGTRSAFTNFCHMPSSRHCAKYS